MVCAVLTERQTSDCDVKCRMTFSFQWKFHVQGPQLGWKTSTMILLKQCKTVWRVFIYLSFIFILYDNRRLDRAAKHYGRFKPLDDYAVLPNFLYTHTCCRQNLLRSRRFATLAALASNIYVRTKKKFNSIFFFIFVRILQIEVGWGGDINVSSNFINLAKYPFYVILCV